MRDRISYLHVLPGFISKDEYRKWVEEKDLLIYLVSLETYWAQLEFETDEEFEEYSNLWKEFKSSHQP